MRLTQQEQHTIIDAVREVMGSETEIWLFGSRVTDTAHGGDIDLYLESPPWTIR